MIKILKSLVEKIPFFNSKNKVRVEFFPLPDGTNGESRIKTLEKLDQSFEPISADLLSDIQTLSEQSSAFVKFYIRDKDTFDLKDYDEAFRIWQKFRPADYTDDVVMQLFGSYLGELCVKELNMEWAITNDEFGSSICVKGREAQITAYPFDTVQKRIDSNEHYFMYLVFHNIKKMYESGDYAKRT